MAGMFPIKMTSAPVLSALLAALLTFGCSTTPAPEPDAMPEAVAPDRALTLEEEAMILQLEDRREYDRAVAMGWARHPNAIHRSRLALALARIGEATFADNDGDGLKDADETMAGIEPLAVLAKDADPRVRRNAAFAFGELGDAAGIQFLLELAHDREHADVASEAVEALSKLARFVPIETYLSFAEPGIAEGIRTRALRFLFRFETPVAMEAASAALDDPLFVIRREAAYSLGRRAHPPARERLESLITEADLLTRANAVKALGLIADAASVPVLVDSLRDAHPWVRTNGARALMAVAEQRPTVTERLTTGDALVRVLNLTQDPDPGTSAVATELLGWLAPRSEPARRRLLKIAIEEPLWYRELAVGAIARHLSETNLDLLLPLLQTDARWIKIRAIEGAASVSSAGPRLRARYAEDPDPSVRSAAVAAIPDAAVDAELAIIERLLDDSDPVVRASAIERFGKQTEKPVATAVEKLLEAERRARTDALNDARLASISALATLEFEDRATHLRSWVGDEDPVVRRLAAESLERIGEALPQYTPLPMQRPWSEYLDIVRWARESHTATIHTARGDVGIVLQPHDAPITAWNFAKLAATGYYNDTSFMRVVPNFVIQGGDPRNDMSGGPGYAIRDEMHLQKYTRGAVGMALAGPDTGGSQFFIAHSPQHHLDGGYTIFGRVVSGMSGVVDRMHRGDAVTGIDIDDFSAPGDPFVAERPPLPLEIGPTTPERCLAVIPEYRERKEAYEPDPAVLQMIAMSLRPEDRIEVYLGTWCSDSQREVPKFLAILDQLRADFGVEPEIRYVAVDRAKQEPSELIAGKDIELVATFIVYRDDQELGRIVETPQGLFEDDLLAIVAQ